jgi:hypothetical protein
MFWIPRPIPRLVKQIFIPSFSDTVFQVETVQIPNEASADSGEEDTEIFDVYDDDTSSDSEDMEVDLD